MAYWNSIAKSMIKLRRVNGGGLHLPSLFYTSSAAISSVQPHSTDASLQSPEKETRQRWSRWLLFVPGAISFGLGTWQIFRRQDKVQLLEYRKSRMAMEPLKFDHAFQLNEGEKSVEYRKVLCRGVFDEGRSIYLGPRSRSISGVTTNGYFVITPLVPIPTDPNSLQTPVLVNRGWVPRSWRDKALEIPHDSEHQSKQETQEIQETERSSWWKFWAKKPKLSQDHAPTVSSNEVIGIVRGSEKPSIFVPENEPNSGQWFYVDVPAIARACGLPEDTFYIEDIEENANPINPYPIPKDVNTLIRSSVMPQDHLNYTLTWYSLSAAVTFMAFKRLRQKKNPRELFFASTQR